MKLESMGTMNFKDANLNSHFFFAKSVFFAKFVIGYVKIGVATGEKGVQLLAVFTILWGKGSGGPARGIWSIGGEWAVYVGWEFNPSRPAGRPGFHPAGDAVLLRRGEEPPHHLRLRIVDQLRRRYANDNIKMS